MDLIAIVGEGGVVPEIQKLTNPGQLDAFRSLCVLTCFCYTQ